MPHRAKPHPHRWALLVLAVVALSSLAPVACKDLSLGMNLGTRLEINQGELDYTKLVSSPPWPPSSETTW